MKETMRIYQAKYVDGDFFPDAQCQIFSEEEVFFSSKEEAIKYLKKSFELSEEETKTLQEEGEVEREEDDFFNLRIFSVTEIRVYSSAVEVENSTTE